MEHNNINGGNLIPQHLVKFLFFHLCDRTTRPDSIYSSTRSLIQHLFWSIGHLSPKHEPYPLWPQYIPKYLKKNYNNFYFFNFTPKISTFLILLYVALMKDCTVMKLY